MAHGIQVFNEDGSVQFDATNRLFRRLTTITTTTAAGSTTVPEYAGHGTPEVVIESQSDTDPRTASLSGRNLNWSSGAAGRIHVLVY